MASSPLFIAQDGADFQVDVSSRSSSGIRKTVLKVDGTTGQLLREGSPVLAGSPFLNRIGLGTDASSTPQQITITGTAVGDKVVFAWNLTDLTDASTSFESTVSVAGKIVQTATDLSAKKIGILICKQA